MKVNLGWVGSKDGLRKADIIAKSNLLKDKDSVISMGFLIIGVIGILRGAFRSGALSAMDSHRKALIEADLTKPDPNDPLMYKHSDHEIEIY